MSLTVNAVFESFKGALITRESVTEKRLFDNVITVGSSTVYITDSEKQEILNKLTSK